MLAGLARSGYRMLMKSGYPWTCPNSDRAEAPPATSTVHHLTASVTMFGSGRSRTRSAVELRADAQQNIVTTEAPPGSIGTRNRYLAIGATTKRFVHALEL
ncbi:hypothetical protein FJTKL_14927 [Diaporthe vaccinii]|uniref:Uncharacterized protein n=1 Tax=Diaporthe vaccinii TaxID=105482 RepID=A0ABR4E6N6_9PEZI